MLNPQVMLKLDFVTDYVQINLNHVQKTYVQQNFNHVQ